jgi:hypothetical protein
MVLVPNRLRYPTPYPDVNALLDTLLAGVQAALGNNLIGMYLHGSLATGDFDPDRSDIDFLVVIREQLSPEMVLALNEMHAQIAASNLKWSTNYEGSYIPKHAIRRYDPAHSLHMVIRVEGSFGMDEHRSDWVIQRHIIRERGIVLVGPSPKTLIDPVSPDELRLAALQLLEEWWLPQLDDQFRLRDSEYQAYAILTMCRALFTIESGKIVSKPEAAQWARQSLEEKWARLIDSALFWRKGVELDCLDQVLDFIRYTLKRNGLMRDRD